MPEEPLSPGALDTDEVVATVDREGSEESFVLADLTRDDAWISMEASEAPVLPSWR